MKSTSVRVNKEREEFLIKEFGTAGGGLAQCAVIVENAAKAGFPVNDITESLQILSQIRAYSLREIKGKLSNQEWMYLADSLNGTMITPEFRANRGGLIASIEDGNDFDGLGEKWSVNVKEFIDKVNTLTGAQVDAVYTRVAQFWNSKDRDLDKWAEW